MADPIMVIIPFMYQTTFWPDTECLQSISGLPSPLRSAVPANIQAGSTAVSMADPVMVIPFMYQTTFWPVALFLQRILREEEVVGGGVVPPARMKVAVTPVGAFIITVQLVAIPEQPPDQPPNVEPVPGAAVRVTDIPAGKIVPDGFVVTVPVPVPAMLMVMV